MNPAIAVHVHVTCEPGAREKLFEHYRPLVAAAQTNPGLIIYYVGTPVNDETETDVIVFEMHADRDAFEAHLNTPEMTEFRNKATGLIKERSVKLATPIGQSFLRPPGEGEPGLTITARMEYAETADMDDVLAKSAELIAHTRANEPRTQSYLWAVEEGNPRTILVFEEFETPEFCFDTHMKTEPFIAATSAETEGLVATPTFSGRRFGFVRGWMG